MKLYIFFHPAEKHIFDYFNFFPKKGDFIKHKTI